jgi:cysteine desulfurase
MSPVNAAGAVDSDKLMALIDEQTVLVSVMLVNNELGSLQPLREIAAALCDLRRARLKKGNKLPLYLHSDAAQAANYLDLHVSRLGVDMLSLNGGKIYGPKGAGLLYVKAGTKLSPVSEGGGQEFGLRSGTENLALIAGLVVALERAQNSHKEENRHLNGLRSVFEKDLLSLSPAVSINGGTRRAPHIVSLSIEGQDNESLMMKLDELGVRCAVGSACSASSDEPSHVLKAIGLSDEQARTTLRFSLGRQTTADDLKLVVAALASILKA